MNGACSRRQAGVSLIEVLVATLVLSVGFVGQAAMQVVGVRTSNESLYRSQAVALAGSMVERLSAFESLRLNLPNVDSRQMDCASPPRSCETQHGAMAQSCSATEMLAWDVHATYCGRPASVGLRAGGIRQLLPAGRLRIQSGRGPGTVDVVVSWSEFETDGDSRVDQDQDGDALAMTRRVSLPVVL